MGRKYLVRKEDKQKTHLKRSKLFARYGKAIYVSARRGGTNLESNDELRHLIERAKRDDVPGDIIERNLKKAEESSGEDFEHVRYEGFGPGGSAFLIDALTDNVNRTVSDVRYCFTKIGSKLGVRGAVEHLYDHHSYLLVRGFGEDELLDLLIEEDLEVIDLSNEADGVLVVGNGKDHDKLEAAFRRHGLDIVHSESGWYPRTLVELDEEQYARFEQFMELINDYDDIQAVYHNVKLKASADEES